MSIRQLAPDVAAKIAAGEVVERPASVVKELIENSIDAGATQIRVDLTNGGLQLIRVVDNGSGIAAEELPLALARHATSKVAQIDDLERIRSLGFRGEALASIAAVAEVTLLSRYRGVDQGAQVSAADGLISKVSAAASPEGTMLTVRNLFSAVPARLKFLKGRNTEVSHCHHMLEQYALAYPEIRFNVFSDGRQIFATPGDGQLVSTLIEVYGLQVAEQMVPISSLDGDERDNDPERPIVNGYTSLPACYKSTRQHISFFVNRRWVLSRMLTSAVEEAYHSLLLTGRHPIAVINIALDPALLDVNVHPAKTEIRFLRERRVYAAVQRAVRNGLLVEAVMPTWGDGNRAGKGKQDIAAQTAGPAITGEVVADRDDDGLDEREEQPAAVDNDESDTPTFPHDNPWLTVTEEESGSKPPLLSRLWQSHVRQTEPAPLPRVPARGPSSSPGCGSPTMDGDAPRAADGGDRVDGDAALAADGGDRVGAEVQHSFGGAMETPSMVGTPITGVMGMGIGIEATGTKGVVPERGRRLPALRVIGQLAQSYIVTEGPDGLYLIDQHAAHERILLERMVAALQASSPISQILLTPLQLELAPTEVEAIEEQLPSLERIGFALEIGDVNMLAVRAVPGVLVKQMNARSMHELLGDLTSPEHAGEGHTETWEEYALANVACKAAIKANYFLTVSEMREMIEQLEHTNAPYSCCHGRPTMVHMSLPALEHEFERR